MTLAHFDSRNSSEIVFQILKIGSRAYGTVRHELIFIHALARPCHGHPKTENNNIYYAPDSGMLFISHVEIWTGHQKIRHDERAFYRAARSVVPSIERI